MLADAGTGKYTYVKGGYYEGGWLDGLKSDRGIQEFPDGSVYDGAPPVSASLAAIVPSGAQQGHAAQAGLGSQTVDPGP